MILILRVEKPWFKVEVLCLKQSKTRYRKSRMPCSHITNHGRAFLTKVIVDCMLVIFSFFLTNPVTWFHCSGVVQLATMVKDKLSFQKNVACKSNKALRALEVLWLETNDLGLILRNHGFQLISRVT